MQTFGLIGFPLEHSFSAKFFNKKFKNENIDAEYINFEIDEIGKITEIVRSNPNLKGLNVTIPYKEQVFDFLDDVSDEAQKIGAVNVIKVEQVDGEQNRRKLIGYNTDYIGFKNSISPLINPEVHKKALILGTGGASKAVTHALSDLGIDWKYVSRTSAEDRLTYNDLNQAVLEEYTVIVNASPIGTFPDINQAPAIPYQYITAAHLLYDLVYNPAETKFLNKGKIRGAATKNGAEMLELQALAAWEIWNG